MTTKVYATCVVMLVLDTLVAMLAASPYKNYWRAYEREAVLKKLVDLERKWEVGK